jgi:2-(1,2-epoxy-1,2-dihydrophenyl)acetyl-CoA isomerase
MSTSQAPDPTGYESVRVHTDGPLRRIELHRPEALNAWTPAMARELLDALKVASADDAVRAIVITGAGRAFSAGADVKVPREITPEGHPDLHTRLEEIYNPIVLTVRDAPKPVIAGVQGAAAGLGASLALACDFIVATDSAYFLLAFVHLGVAPDAGSLPNLARRIGPARAARLAMLGERLPAQQAADWGLVTEVVAPEALTEAVDALAARLAAGPTVALATMKRILAAAEELPPAELLALEASLQQRHATTTDYAEGVAAFKEKRRPSFTGA